MHTATAVVAGTVLGVFAVAGRLALGSGEQAVVPAGKFSLKGIFEVITEFIIGMVDMVIGEHGRKYTPFFAAIFFYIWINNMIGLLPGMTAATDNMNTTLALGLFVFAVYNTLGVKENGWAYLKHFFGPVWWLAWLIVLIEIMSHLLRPMTLGLRLRGNISADHTVLSIFLDLVPWVVPMVFYGMGIFVASMQAFVFTVLSMVYVSMAVAHEH
ncbi:MAG: F0F1 ATP synthase subunit A [Bdellovibrionales bacterium]